MIPGTVLGRAGRILLDFALPPRCAACGTIVADVDLFCGSCWPEIHFLSGGCQRCAQPLEATEAELCGACHVDAGALDRIRAAVEYGEAARSIAIRLKYGRKTGLARTMAAYMRRPLGDLPPDALLVPVPLHRVRLWERGFNQAALIARQLQKTSGNPADMMLLQRVKRTPKLKGMSPAERRRAVSGAFAVRQGQEVRGRSIILVDDVYTTGSTAEACARLLKRKGAASVDLIAWARVVRPTVVNG
ncbi:double zinc ribbon domain-containing protein [Sphingomonas arenae]|uniref:double zinc ribbon domain-containing protein n=1 Tax=Sphingomonas arenae TaxID=2812555 RepID=UPI001966D01E